MQLLAHILLTLVVGFSGPEGLGEDIFTETYDVADLIVSRRDSRPPVPVDMTKIIEQTAMQILGCLAAGKKPPVTSSR